MTQHGMTEEQEKRAFYQCLGEALSAWSSVESALCMLFSVLITGRPHVSRLALVFYAIENFRSKQQVVNTLALQVITNKNWLARWESIHKHLPRRAARRNALAHHDVVLDPKGKSERRFGIVPPMWDPSTAIGLSSGKIKALHYKDIDQIRLEILELVGDIHKLARDIELATPEPTSS